MHGDKKLEKLYQNYTNLMVVFGERYCIFYIKLTFYSKARKHVNIGGLVPPYSLARFPNLATLDAVNLIVDFNDNTNL